MNSVNIRTFETFCSQFPELLRLVMLSISDAKSFGNLLLATKPARKCLTCEDLELIKTSMLVHVDTKEFVGFILPNGGKHGLCEKFIYSRQDGRLLGRANQMYKDGKRHGTFEFLNAKGALIETGNFLDGFQQGEWRAFYGNGKVKHITSYEKGARSGLELFYDTQEVCTKILVNTLTFDKNGNPVKEVTRDLESQDLETDEYCEYNFCGFKTKSGRVTPISHGPWLHINGNGNGKGFSKGYFKNGKKDGLWHIRIITPTGSETESFGSFDNGIKKGLWVKTLKGRLLARKEMGAYSGKSETKRQKILGDKTGVWMIETIRTNDPKNKTIERGSFEQDKRTGFWTRQTINIHTGKVIVSRGVNYAYGKKEGEWK